MQWSTWRETLTYLATRKHPTWTTSNSGGASWTPQNSKLIIVIVCCCFLLYELVNSFVPQGTNLRSLDPSMRKTLHQMIYDEFVGAIFKLTKRLDLSFRSSFPEVHVIYR